MDIFGSGIPLGRYFGINVRLHWAFIVYAYWRISQWGDLFYGLAFILGLYFCILLHEFGHALAARWCDGEANDILLWPLGGLAYCQPAWNPTAHLITSAAGPFVTLVLWLVLGGVAQLSGKYLDAPVFTWFVMKLSETNLFLLLFNLVPAFPMDGGRILRDTLWHWMRAVTATRIAVWCCRSVAVSVAILIFVPMEFWLNTVEVSLPAWLWKVVMFCSGHYWLLLLVGFSIFQARREEEIVGMEAMGTYEFSLRERWKRGRRQRGFRRAVAESRQEGAFHRCTECGRTERDLQTLEFRVCSDCRNGEEYCQEHLDNHTHV